MKELLEELDVQISNYESNTWDTISFVLYIKLNGVMYQTHWNGGFENCKQIKSVKIIDGIDLVDCGENEDLIDFVNSDKVYDFMKFLSDTVKEHSNKFDSISFALGFSIDLRGFGWDMYFWDGSYKYAGESDSTKITEESC